MDKLFKKTTELRSLRHAWYRIRSNGIRSPQRETRNAIKHFERDADRRIYNIQRQLRNNTFEFDPQKGVLKKKSSGSKRGIVMASVQNRIVERALLDCLQNNVTFIQDVITTPTSIGGVPDRSVPHGLAIIREAIKTKKYFIRSDITGFFDHIPRNDVIKIISKHIHDKIFINLLEEATTVTLANEEALGEDRKVFPTSEEGIAQGSPLSPLFGNILLHDFDKQLNASERGIVCVRFIDDFIMFGAKKTHVKKAFLNARTHLNNLGLQCHDPFSRDTPKEKAQQDEVEKGFIFLGYGIGLNYIQPSENAISSLLDTISNHITRGRHAILNVLRSENSFKERQRYIQTLDTLDRVIRGWGDAFSYTDKPNILDAVDRDIENKINNFRKWYKKTINSTGWRNRRRTGGVCLLSDIEPKYLDTLPYKLEKRKRYRTSKNMTTISTDGSVIGTGPYEGFDKGSGG